MKATFLFLLFLLSSIRIYCQDLIVTSENDSIKSKISKVDEDKIYFSFKSTKGTINTFLSHNNVLKFDYDFYKKPYSSFRAAFDFGFSYRIARIHEDVPSYLIDHAKKLKSGFNFGVNLSHFFNQKNGIGLKYSLHSSKANERIFGLPWGSSTIDDKIGITYIAPYYTRRVMNNAFNKAWFFNIGLGYLYYENIGKLFSEFNLTGETIGFNLDIGHDFNVTENFGLGFQISYVIGTLTEFKDGSTSISLNEKDYESLNRLDLTMGIRFY
ncbi:MAG: hypothetical protein ACFHWX_03635 [Bacteroidota bacterium]